REPCISRCLPDREEGQAEQQELDCEQSSGPHARCTNEYERADRNADAGEGREQADAARPLQSERSEGLALLNRDAVEEYATKQRSRRDSGDVSRRECGSLRQSSRLPLFWIPGEKQHRR